MPSWLKTTLLLYGVGGAVTWYLWETAGGTTLPDALANKNQSQALQYYLAWPLYILPMLNLSLQNFQPATGTGAGDQVASSGAPQQASSSPPKFTGLGA